MNKLALDFSDLKQQKRLQANSVVAGLLLLIVVGLFMEYKQINAHIGVAEDKIALLQGRKPVKYAKPSQDDLRKMHMASRVQEQLNFPWYELLETIEQVKYVATPVKLVSIRPNRTKQEVLINAESPNLETMLAFVALLEQQAILYDVLLVSQRQLDKNMGLEFMIKVRWRV